MKSFSFKCLIFSIFMLIVLIDQVTKYFILNNLKEQLHISSFFSLTLSFNSGISFSMLNGQNQYILIAISLCIIIAMIVFMEKKQSKVIMGMAMISGGALGNIIDRISVGAVVDFLDFHIAKYSYPIFNVADCAICCGCALILYCSQKDTEHT